jgi:hypothetical protein
MRVVARKTKKEVFLQKGALKKEEKRVKLTGSTESDTPRYKTHHETITSYTRDINPYKRCLT